LVVSVIKLVQYCGAASIKSAILHDTLDNETKMTGVIASFEILFPEFSKGIKKYKASMW
jgi:hypothetical protein